MTLKSRQIRISLGQVCSGFEIDLGICVDIDVQVRGLDSELLLFSRAPQLVFQGAQIGHGLFEAFLLILHIYILVSLVLACCCPAEVIDLHPMYHGYPIVDISVKSSICPAHYSAPVASDQIKDASDVPALFVRSNGLGIGVSSRVGL